MPSTTVAKRQKVQSLGRGMGSIWQYTRADGSPVYYHICHLDGRQHEVKLAATNLTAARKECAARSTKRDAGELAAPSKRTLGEVAEELFSILEARVVSGELRSSTLALYRQRYRSHLEPRLGRKVLQRVSGSDIATVISEMRRKDLSPSLISGTLMFLGQVLDFAVQRRYIAITPMAQLSRAERPGVKTRTQPRVLNLEEINALIAAAPASIRDFLTFVAHTGCRLSEALAIRWCDLDLENGTAEITGQLERKTHRRVPTKTSTGNREVFLPDALVSILKARRVQAFSRGIHFPEALVFCTRTGAPLSHRNVSREITRAGDTAGLNAAKQPVSCHDLRHSAVSRWIANGIDVATVAALPGDRVETILRVYSHAYEMAQRGPELREKIQAAIG